MKFRSFQQFKIIKESQDFFKEIIPQDIANLYELFKKNNKKLYIVGGAVRDVIMGKYPKDFDLATDAFPEEVIEIVTKGGYSTIGEVGHKFGVVIVQTPSNKEGFEIATFREDLTSGRRPDEVKYSTIENDVLRRDLTVNALFYDIGKAEIVDLVGGVKDINQELINTVGDAEDRFQEDPLRKLRSLRFASKADFKLSDKIIKAIKKDNSLKGVSKERIRDEFKKSIETSPKPFYYLKLLTDLNLWEVMFPGLDISTDFLSTNTWIIQLSHLFRNNSEKTLRKEMNNLTFTSDEIKSVIFLLKMRDFKPEDVFEHYKYFKKTSINNETLLEFAQIYNLDMKLMKKFLNYEPTTDGNWVRSYYNLRGKEVGSEIKKIEGEKFKKSL